MIETMDDLPQEANPTHLLLIADTKMGKSTYAAQCAIDGFHLLYIDSDNGVSALDHALKDNVEARRRVVTIRTEKPATFLTELMTRGIFRWNRTQDKVFSSGMAADSDKMVEIVPALIPPGVIVVDDSWTSTALEAMEAGANSNSTDLLRMASDNRAQQVYGEAGTRLTVICAIIQKSKFNSIVLAHPCTYEKYEKPKGRQGDTKQKDMILVDTVTVPLSSSKPHGESMGKYFTDIGWIELTRANQRILNFELEYKRIGGGRPNKKGPISEMSFKSLFGDPIPGTEFSENWIRMMTAGEWKEANKNSGASKPTGVNPDGKVTSSPVKSSVNALMKKA